MTPEQNSKCHIIIHSAATAAAGVGAGLAQLPGADCVALVGIQTGMVVSLGKVFNKPIAQGSAAAAVGTLLASTIGKVAAKVLAGVICRWIPGVGNYVNGTVAFSVTETLGWTVADEIDKGLFG